MTEPDENTYDEEPPEWSFEGLESMLAELGAQLDRARQHEEKMRATLPESESWSRPNDRAWLVEAVAEAEQMTRDAEARLAEGRRIVARVRGGGDA